MYQSDPSTSTSVLRLHLHCFKHPSHWERYIFQFKAAMKSIWDVFICVIASVLHAKTAVTLLQIPHICLSSLCLCPSLFCFRFLNQEPVWITGCPHQPQPPALTCTRSMSEQTCLSRRSKQRNITTKRCLRPLAANLRARWR